MIGELVAAIFNTKANNLSKSAFADPRMVKLFKKYEEDTKAFKQELKDRGVYDLNDLRTAIKTNPLAKNFKL